jgi:alpha-galactosidase/6-phospho-beta-glucosidase family protein
MYIENNVAKDVHITYIGGGSRGWAWNLMSDLAQEEQLEGIVTLYDIDIEAADNNVVIGNKMQEMRKKKNFVYQSCSNLKESLKYADFVVISILPGSFDEMEIDVHLPEKYGIYQSVGDTAGPGGILRALRTLPMYVEIAEAIREVCPEAWVINYTNPMGACVRILYEVFPEIKAFGCCHEVFGTQELLARLVEEEYGIQEVKRSDIKVNVQGLNHFTWLTEASYQGKDLFPLYRKAAETYRDGLELEAGKNWMNNHFASANCVKFDLFRRYGKIAAAGDRHLAEFCPGWYLKTPEVANRYKFALTPVSWRKENLKKLLEKSRKRVSGEEEIKIEPSGEEGVRQMKAILGLDTFITNVNMPNRGQISNIDTGVVVETNAVFSCNSVKPVFSGKMPEDLLTLTYPHIYSQGAVVRACKEKNLEYAFKAFAQDPQVNLSLDKVQELFSEMVEKTANYLVYYVR